MNEFFTGLKHDIMLLLSAESLVGLVSNSIFCFACFNIVINCSIWAYAALFISFS